MAVAKIKLLICLTLISVLVKAEDDLRDFDFEPEMMIAQESRQYQTIVKPPYKMPKQHVKIIKPNGITNSHRPQYNIDSEEEFNKEYLADLFETSTKKTLEKSYRPSHKLRSKETMIREAVLRALERKDHVGKFAQIVPIIRSMSGTQRVALASLVASQVTTPPGRTPLNLAQVRSMFGNDANTSSELMLPILLDMANLIRKAVRPGKDTREVRIPQTQMLRRSIEVDEEEEEDTLLNDEPFETYEEITTTTTTTKAPKTNRARIRNTRVRIPQPTQNRAVKTDRVDVKTNTVDTEKVVKNTSNTNPRDGGDARNSTKYSSTFSSSSSTSSSTTETASSMAKPSSANQPRSLDNATMDLAADSTNQTLAQDLPVAEKLRSINRYVDRKGNLMRRGNFPKPSPPATRRTTAEPSLSPLAARRRPPPSRIQKLQGLKNGVGALGTDDGKCELFTNSLCLHAEDYPTELIIQSIRRNKAAAGALLADFKDPGEGAVDGVTAQQEAKYTAEHYLVSNRRGDTAHRDFAGAGEAGFMCPSTVKYARPQRARATSGQWKYIVNTGEHTQTLRLEKCLKPKDSCTYLTDNFKSKCVQVYNYHRLLTWDQQNGLHMDIFKVPTCCSCHIEGYSVAFPPLGHRAHESSSETFPGDDLSSEHGNAAFESVQSTMQRPSVTKKPFGLKPLENFPSSISEHHNLISGSGFPSVNMDDGDDLHNRDLPPTSPMDSYGNSYFPDSFNQASNIRNVKRPLKGRNPTGASETGTGMDGVTLPSYLEPPTPSAGSSFSFVKEPMSKYKITSSNQFKRGAPSRPSRRPIRKKISGVPDDLVSSGTSAVDVSSSHVETLEDFNDDLEEPDVLPIKNAQSKATIAPKLPSAESSSTTARPDGKKSAKKENTAPNGKRVNYNYHPIIDFFEEDKSDSSIDREDAVPEYSSAVQSEWKPIDLPANRNGNSNLVGRKKH